ncbi:MAG: amidohydrolase, partial [Oscillospiraceae bacterium]
KEPVEGQSCGHGCGHCLMAGANVAAAVGIKAEMEAKNLPGTLVFLGCPAEEQLTGKVFMARGHAFDGLDIALSYHPLFTTEVSVGNSSAMNTAKFHFKGRTAHAGGDPHNGRSALDAVELMNVGANYLREHVTSDVRIHYTITEGGTAPNIVPDKACVWYYVRALSREAVEDTYARLVKIAKGAAMMTETEVEEEFLGGCYNTLNNKVLANLVKDTMHEIPQEPWTDEEIAFAKALNEQSPQYKAGCAAVNRPEGTQLYEGPMEIETANSYGSTDVGDVQHIVPGIMIRTATYNIGAPGHSWQITACSGMSIGEKGMNRAAQVMAVSALKVLNDTSIYEAAKAEFDQEMAGKKYVCPIPAEVPVPYTK